MTNVMDMVGVGQNTEVEGVIMFCILSGTLLCLAQTIWRVTQKKECQGFLGQFYVKRKEELR